MIEPKPGVYSLRWTSHIYFGSTSDLRRRKSSHFSSFRRNKASRRMMEIVSKHGSPEFCVEMITPTTDQSRELEQLILDVYDGERFLINTLATVSFNEQGGPAKSCIFNGKHYNSLTEARKDSGLAVSQATFSKWFNFGCTSDVEMSKMITNRNFERERRYSRSRLICYFNGRYWPNYEAPMKSSCFVRLYGSDDKLDTFRALIKAGCVSDYHIYLRRFKAYKSKCYKTLKEAAIANNVTEKDVQDWRNNNQEAAAKTERIFARIHTTHRYYPRGKKFVI